MVRDTPPKIRRGIYCFRMFLNSPPFFQGGVPHSDRAGFE